MLDRALRELESYLRYEDGWDGYRAAPFDPAVIEEAKRVVTYVARMVPGVVIETEPCSNGDVLLEFRFEGRVIVFDISPLDLGSRSPVGVVAHLLAPVAVVKGVDPIQVLRESLAAEIRAVEDSTWPEPEDRYYTWRRDWYLVRKLSEWHSLVAFAQLVSK